MAQQATTADKVWDALLKLNVAAACVLAGMILNHDSRITKVEGVAQQNIKDISKVDTKIDAQGAQVLQRLDRLIVSLESLGNRMTRIETKLEGR